MVVLFFQVITMSKKFFILFLIFFYLGCSYNETLILKAANLSYTKSELSGMQVSDAVNEYESCGSYHLFTIYLEKLKKGNSDIIGFYNIKLEYFLGADPTREVNCIKVSGYPIFRKIEK